MTGAHKKPTKELASSLQMVALLSTKLRRQLAESAQEALELEAAGDPAVSATRRLRAPRIRNR